MKQQLFLFALMLASVCGLAQTKGTAKLYGYVQEVSQGKAPEVSEGTQVSTNSGKNYFLYAASAARIYPVEVWIYGKRYGVGLSTVKQTPVEWGDDRNIGASKKTLVPKTNLKVIQLELRGTMEEKTVGKSARAQAKSNELVLVYKQAGKFYYATSKKLGQLDRAALQ